MLGALLLGLTRVIYLFHNESVPNMGIHGAGPFNEPTRLAGAFARLAGAFARRGGSFTVSYSIAPQSLLLN